MADIIDLIRADQLHIMRWRRHPRDQYPQAPPQIPTCQLRQDGQAPAAVPRLADPAFGPLACTCRACTRTLDRVLC